MGKEVAGDIPEFGAIFMANSITIEECLDRRLLGLPYAFISFVKRVKTGMILFLFEYGERKLYGVYEAVSNGGFNIVPNAYASSGRQFPAQVKFTIIWQCSPLSEDEFRGAIRENYFDRHKFNFGLSKEQIQRLLWLFNSLKVQMTSYPSFERFKLQNREHKCSSGEAMEGKSKTRKVSRMKLDKQISIEPVAAASGGSSHDNLNNLVNSGEVSEEDLSVVGCHRWLSFGNSDDISRLPKCPPYDDAYDPECPGFNYSMNLGGCLNSCPGDGSVSLPNNDLRSFGAARVQEGAQNSHTSSVSETSGLGDFIPLSSPDRLDSAIDEGILTTGAYFMNYEVPVSSIVGRKDAVFSGPYVPVIPISTCENLEGIKIGNTLTNLTGEGTDRHKVDTIFSAALPFSDTGDHYLKDGSNSSEKLKRKTLHSDWPSKRTSVFSRLSFASNELRDFTNVRGRMYNTRTQKNSCEKRKNLDISAIPVMQSHSNFKMTKSSSLGQVHDHHEVASRPSVISHLSKIGDEIISGNFVDNCGGTLPNVRFDAENESVIEGFEVKAKSPREGW